MINLQALRFPASKLHCYKENNIHLNTRVDECPLELAGPVLESKGMHAIFSEKGQKKRANKGKIFENLGKNVQNLKIF